MVCWDGALGIEEQLLVQLLARAGAGTDLDVGTDLEARPDQVPAGSSTLTFPMSRTNTSPPPDRPPAARLHRFQYRHEVPTHLGWVTVTGRHSESGGNVGAHAASAAERYRSARRRTSADGSPRSLDDLLGDALVAPMMFAGHTALSVEISTRCSAPNSAAEPAFRVPSALLATASATLPSMSGTCLWAAAWNAE